MWITSENKYEEREIMLMIIGLLSIAKYDIAIDLLGEDINNLIEKLMEEIKEK